MSEDPYDKIILSIINIADSNNINSITSKLCNSHKISPKKSKLLYAYKHLIETKQIQPSDIINKYLKRKIKKGLSGITSVTVLTSPYPEINGIKKEFSCKYNCSMCPSEPNMPKSYLASEPAVLRGNRNGWDPIKQFNDRLETLNRNGHDGNKIELLILGGTWDSHDIIYREDFVHKLFYAANTFYLKEKRPIDTFENEKLFNEDGLVRLIGITIETRPDQINKKSLRHYRKCGITRVQLGIQHIDDTILKGINRMCYHRHTLMADKRLKDCCFKDDFHIMLDLPNSSIEKDREMFDYFLNTEECCPDQVKLYPTEVVPYTEIQKWYQDGTYIPYGTEGIKELLMYYKPKIQPWVRINRIIRDIPMQYIEGGNDLPNMRQYLQQQGVRCNCIRCREISDIDFKMDDLELITRHYKCCDGDEYFISYEHTALDKICGFIRLRLSPTSGLDIFESLKDSALIRELHVYGKVVSTHESNKEVQNIGLGSKLLKYAESVSLTNGYNKLSIISGVGVRGFYRKRGYELVKDGEFMQKIFPIDMINGKGSY